MFLQEQKLYAFKDLKTHEKQGDKDTLVKHEYCQFCKKYLYDKDKVYDHLNKSHETCFLCERSGIHYQYYKGYPELVSTLSRNPNLWRTSIFEKLISCVMNLNVYKKSLWHLQRKQTFIYTRFVRHYLFDSV